MFLEFFKAVGAVGLVLVIAGILVKKRKAQSVLFICGGLCLEAYSISIQDIIFIVLQFFFTAAAAYELIKLHRFGK